MPDLDRYGGSKAFEVHCAMEEERRQRQLENGSCRHCFKSRLKKVLIYEVAFCIENDCFVDPDSSPLDMGCEDVYEDGD